VGLPVGIRVVEDMLHPVADSMVAAVKLRTAVVHSDPVVPHTAVALHTVEMRREVEERNHIVHPVPALALVLPVQVEVPVALPVQVAARVALPVQVLPVPALALVAARALDFPASPAVQEYPEFDLAPESRLQMEAAERQRLVQTRCVYRSLCKKPRLHLIRCRISDSS